MNLSLLTDFYELTMLQGYFLNRPAGGAVFEMFFRHQPFGGGYTVFAGLGPFLDALEGLRFGSDELEYLKSLGRFRGEFLEFLKGFRFRGDLDAPPEGTVLFPGEPVLRAGGSLVETQFIESLLLNFINFQSLIATKTSRIVDAAGDAPVLEFGLRRAHGSDGALSASRAAFIGGASATSNTLAGKMHGIPVSGTMAHSWIMSFDTELESFERYAELYPGNCVLLVDTFDTLRSGVPNAIKVFAGMKGGGLLAVRIDSGDLDYLSRKSREMLDGAGLPEVKIVASGDVDEWIITQLGAGGAPIDFWGVGTRLVTGGDDPALSGVYKIVARERDGAYEPCMKVSNQPEKITNPGAKNVLRFYDDGGSFLCDLLFLEEERDEVLALAERRAPIRFNHPSSELSGFTLDGYAGGGILLQPVMRGGRRLSGPVSLDEMSRYRRRQVCSLDETCRRLINPHTYRVSLTDRLKALKVRLMADMKPRG